MSKNRSYTLLTGVVMSCVGLFLGTGECFAQANNPFKNIDTRNQLASQKLSKEINNALEQVRDLQRSNPTEALKILQVYKSVLENDNVLTQKNRSYYLSYVNGYLAKVKRNEKVQKVIQKQESLIAAQKLARQEYLKSNPEAKRVFEQMKTTQGQMKYHRDTYERIQTARAKGFINVMNDLDRSAIPQVGDVTFPK